MGHLNAILVFLFRPNSSRKTSYKAMSFSVPQWDFPSESAIRREDPIDSTTVYELRLVQYLTLRVSNHVSTVILSVP